eukprot:COSAG02_NODE_44600_length_364_cov_3.354717_1_plen_55_part_10
MHGVHQCIRWESESRKELKVLFCTARKILHWWTWLLSTVRSNTRSATLYYLELDT